MWKPNLEFVDLRLAEGLNKRVRGVLPVFDLSPVQITAIYTLFAFFALYVSDVYLPQAIRDPATLAQLQAIKGGVEIVVTAGLIFVLTTQSRRAMEKQNAQVEALQAERSIVYRVVRHNLRNDINVVQGLTDLIRTTTTDPQVRGYCDKIARHAEQIGEYQADVQRIERMLEPPVERGVVDLSAVGHKSTRLRDAQADPDVTVHLGIEDEVFGVAITELWLAVDEVIDNAVRYADRDNPVIEVEVASRGVGSVDLIIRDNGPGIPAHEQAPIDQMEDFNLVHSSGLGLWQAKLACSISGGSLQFPDQTDGGQVIFRLPAPVHWNLWYKFKH